MITVTDAVRSLLSEDGQAIEVFQRGILNTTAYAKEILPKVEAQAKKPVKLGTVVVALNRILESMTTKSTYNPRIRIDNYAITSGLSDISFDKTDQVLRDISSLNYSYIDNANTFFTITIGVHEITIICAAELKDRIQQSISQQPKVVLNNLVALSIRFSDKYIDVPNTIYSLVGMFAIRQINIMEIVSTYTEVTFIILATEMEPAIQALQTYQKTTASSTSNSGVLEKL